MRCQTCFCYGYITASRYPKLAAPGSAACCRGGGAGDL
nr:MAG TPA: hypothetical protein [Caudoviricetes sp.]